jgi:hypothetical protein
MLTTDVVRVVDTRTFWVWDRLALLLEVAAIGAAIDVIAAEHGSRADLEDLHARQQRVYLDVLGQLRAALGPTDDSGTIH